MKTPISPATIVVNAAMESGIIRLTFCDRDWTLLRPADLESRWETISSDEFNEDERLPYWVELWPASLTLALWLRNNRERIADRVCLDLGCGLGFTALVGTWLGAKVLAIDYEAEALVFAQKNAGINALPHPCWLLMDWRKPAIAPKCCDFIWGGDVMYEKRFAEPVFAFLDHALADKGLAWIAEPGRNAYEHFKHTLFSRNWRYSCVTRERVEALHTQNIPVSINLWELSRR